MKIILLVLEKNAIRGYDISTPELRNQAYLSLFRERDKQNYYSLTSFLYFNRERYNYAKAGNAKDAERIIKSRNKYEYEKTQEINIEEL